MATHYINCLELSRSALWQMRPYDAVKTVREPKDGTSRPDGMANWVESPFPILGYLGLQPPFRTLSSQTSALSTFTLSTPSQHRGINRRGQGLVSAMTVICDWVGYQVMELAAWSPNGAALGNRLEGALLQVGDHHNMTLGVACILIFYIVQLLSSTNQPSKCFQRE